MSFIESKERYDDLANGAAYFANAYYVEGVSLISDAEYDSMFNLLKEYEHRHPEHIHPVSPTQFVGGRSGRKTYKHKVPMYSLDNAMDVEDAIERMTSLSKAWGENIAFVHEFKFDGMASQLTYVDGTLRQALKRGDGIEGESIYLHAMSASNVPEKISAEGEVHIKGEFIIYKQSLAVINDSRMNNGYKPYANTRSAVAGILNTIIPTSEVTHLVFRPYDIEIIDTTFESHVGKLETISNLGFSVESYYTGKAHATSVYEKIAEARSSLPYDIDGVVTKIDSVAIQKLAGSTSTVPRWAFAYKFEPEKAESVIMDVTFQVGRTGEVCPVAKITPAKVGGVVITSVQLHNKAKFDRYNLARGDKVEVYRSADCIPRFGEKISSSGATPFEFVKTCPCCGEELTMVEAITYCTNEQCESRLVYSLAYFASKTCMNIDGLGETTSRDLVRSGLVKKFADLYSLTIEQICSLPGYSTVSANKLFKAIDKSRSNPLWRVIAGIGISDVGPVMARNIDRVVFTPIKFTEMTDVDEILKLGIPDLGPATAASIASYMSSPRREELKALLEKLAITLTVYKIDIAAKFDGMTFVFTGSFSSSRGDFEESVRERGGSVKKSVSKNTTYLIAGTSPTADKIKRAKELDIPILSELDFVEMLRN